MKEIEQNVDDSETVLILGGEVDKAKASIRLFGDNLDPDEITRLLKCDPTEAYKKDQIIKTAISQRTVETGMWSLKTEKNSNQTLEEQILELLEKLSKDLEVWSKLSERFEISIYCGAWLKVWNRDIWFSNDALKQIADRKLRIGLAIYCEDE